MDALFEDFRTRAEAVSGEVHRFGTRRDALAFLVEFLRKQEVSDTPAARAVWVRGSLLAGIDPAELTRSVPGLTFDVTRQSAEEARVGISQVESAIAATGTLVTDAGAVERRLASALPVIHVAVAPTRGIERDMAAALARIPPTRSSYISMITGPSRTADIERVLTIGVHGPSRLVIVFVDELEVDG